MKDILQGKDGSFYIAQYPVRWTAQSAIHFLPSLADLFIPGKNIRKGRRQRKWPRKIAKWTGKEGTEAKEVAKKHRQVDRKEHKEGTEAKEVAKKHR